MRAVECSVWNGSGVHSFGRKVHILVIAVNRVYSLMWYTTRTTRHNAVACNTYVSQLWLTPLCVWCVDFANFVVSEEGRKGHELAMAWLYQEYSADRDGSLVCYEEALLTLLEACQSALGPRNKCSTHTRTHTHTHTLVYILAYRTSGT